MTLLEEILSDCFQSLRRTLSDETRRDLIRDLLFAEFPDYVVSTSTNRKCVFDALKICKHRNKVGYFDDDTNFICVDKTEMRMYQLWVINKCAKNDYSWREGINCECDACILESDNATDFLCTMHTSMSDSEFDQVCGEMFQCLPDN